MEMLRQENIPDDPESQFLSEFAPSSHPVVSETLRTVKAGSPGGALRQKVQGVEAIVMVQLGHARIIYPPGRLHRDKKRRDVGATRGGEADIEGTPAGFRCSESPSRRGTGEGLLSGYT
jgi:hypothetical protein